MYSFRLLHLELSFSLGIFFKTCPIINNIKSFLVLNSIFSHCAIHCLPRTIASNMIFLYVTSFETLFFHKTNLLNGSLIFKGEKSFRRESTRKSISTNLVNYNKTTYFRSLFLKLQLYFQFHGAFLDKCKKNLPHSLFEFWGDKTHFRSALGTPYISDNNKIMALT